MAAGLTTLGRYQIERVLGKGAMGVVYEALDPKLGRKVAIKTIRKEHLDDTAARGYSLRFEREARAVARLNHPNIVQVFDFGEEGDVAYIVMEFIRGKELQSFFDANETFDPKDAVRILCELLSALDCAHDAGIIHRDFKPDNVMLDTQGHAKLTGFGLARVRDADRTQAGTTIGTPAYMSPEQVQGQRVDQRTDIFSAGVVLYQLLTSTRPFTGSGAWTVAKKIVEEETPVPSKVNVSLVPEFDQVVLKALAKNPDNRYQSAREFALALQRVVEGMPAEHEDPPTVSALHGADVVEATGHASALRAPERNALEPHASSFRTSAARTSVREVELEFWSSIKDSDDPEEYVLYIEQFPQGAYVQLAQSKIAELRRAVGAVAASEADEVEPGKN